MTGAIHYPKADRSQWFGGAFPGSRIDPNVVVLHTTETTGWPGYRDGKTAPHFTLKANPVTRTVEVRQHFRVDRSARALRNEAGGVETNTLNAVQIELVGTCDPRSSLAGALFWPDAEDWMLRPLADLLRWLHLEWPDFPVKDAALRGWLAYGPDDRRPGVTPASYGASPARLTFDEWRDCYGIVGHQHVPENSHGDPGAFPIARLVELARAVDPAPPAPVETTDIVVTIGTFNNRSYPMQRQAHVNAGDYAFRGMRPDLGGEQERWVPGQLSGFRKIFGNAFFLRNAPLASSGTVVFHRKTMFTRLAKFRFKATDRVPGISGARKFTGEVLAFRGVPGATLTHLSLHLPPSGWGDRFPEGDRRQLAARREVYAGLARVKAFATRQIKGGRDFVVIETDANAKREILLEALGGTIAGKPVHVFTSKHGHRIDHIVVIGEISKVVRQWNTTAPSDHAPFAVRLTLKVPVR